MLGYPAKLPALERGTFLERQGRAVFPSSLADPLEEQARQGTKQQDKGTRTPAVEVCQRTER